MMQEAISQASTGGDVIYPIFEISVFNVDKPPLSVETTAQRVQQFAGKWNVCTTNAPTFIVSFCRCWGLLWF